jgi:thiamine biosynthesis lipoprotein
MGTRVSISIYDVDNRRAAVAITAIEQEMRHWSKDWYAWGAGTGELEKLNQALEAGRPFTASAELLELIARSQQLSSQSGDYFDPVVAPMIDAWGIQHPEHPPAQLPDMQQLDHWIKSRPSMRDVLINGTEISAIRSDIQIDLGAIAKGFAMDLILIDLKRSGIESAVINLGGQLALLGNLDRNSRRISIRDPRAAQFLGEMELNAGECVSTSGDYERSYMRNGFRVHHLLDPHTGMPVNDTQMVTVIATNCTLADAASTAIMAAGAQWQLVAKQLHISQVLRVDATGEIEVTAAMYTQMNSQYPALKAHKLVIVN